MLTRLRWQWSVVRRNKLQFLHWLWLRLTRRTAYRFSPFHISVRTADGVVEQANGLLLPYAWKTPETCDWRAALIEQIEKEEMLAAKANKRKAARRS